MSWPWDGGDVAAKGGSASAGAGLLDGPASDPGLAHPSVANPPGRHQLVYRVGTYDGFVDAMLDRLVMSLAADSGDAPRGARSLSDAAADEDRLVRFNLAAEGNWLVALGHSWAAVADVLVFYQERLIQEGYLQTAVDPRSVYELVHMVGYQPTPGIAGHTDLALTVTDVEGLPEELELPSHLVVRSVPPPGGQPQAFETTLPILARAAWNLLRPDPRSRQMTPEVPAGAISLSLAGAATGLAKGAPLLVTGEVDVAAQGAQHLRSVRRLVKVQPSKDASATLVAWQEPLALDLVRGSGDAVGGSQGTATGPGASDEAARLAALATTPVAGAKVYALPGQAGLFGRSAPQWSSLPPEVKRRYYPLPGGTVLEEDGDWVSRNVGLPVDADVISLAADKDHLYAGTLAHGVYHSDDGGATWVRFEKGLAQLDAPALTVDQRGVVWAGGTSGGVYRSTDHGEIWEDAGGRAVAPPKPATGWRRFWPFGKKGDARGGALPGAVIHDLLALPGSAAGSASALLAATGAGVYRTTDGGQSWQPANRGLPGTQAPAGTTDLAVRKLARGGASGEVWAATLQGVFQSTDGGRRWRPRNRGLPRPDPFTGYSATQANDVVVITGRRQGERLLVATDAGLYRSDDGGEHWQRQPLVPPGLETRSGSRSGPTYLAPPAATDVTRLQVVEDPLTLDRRVHAAAGDDLWVSQDDGSSWRRVEDFPAGPVYALAAGRGTPSALAAAPFGDFPDEWPGFHLRPDRIDLEGLVDGIVPGSWIVLVPGGTEDPTAAGAFAVLGVTQLRRRDFGLDTMVTRVEIHPDPRLLRFDLRDTRVFLDSREVELEPRAVVDHELALRVLGVQLRALPPPRKVIVTGELPGRHMGLDLRPATSVEELGELVQALCDLPSDLVLTLRLWPPGERPEPGSEPGNVLQMLVSDVLTFLRDLRDVGGILTAAASGMRASGVEVDEGAGGVAMAALRPAVSQELGGAERLPKSMAAVLAETVRRMMRQADSHDAAAGDPGRLEKLADDGAVLHAEIEAPPRTIGRVTTVAEVSSRMLDARAVGDGRMEVPLPAVGTEDEPWVSSESLRIFGNVVSATEGTTVRDEILGDGDATQANQVFHLAKPPSFRLGGGPESRQGTDGDAASVVSTLEVRVQGQLWRRVDHLESAGPDDLVYRLDVDEDGMGTVIFGSGEQGSRLPTGRDNVRATYATGMSAGSVPASGVSLLQNRPLGLDSVSNPLPTVPGAAAEPADQARQAAPLSVLTLDRVVSLSDYADFARTVPGIAKAGAWRVRADAEPGRRRGGGMAVQVTVAADGGAAAPSGVLEEVRAALAARRAVDLPLFVQSYRHVRLRVAAKLLVDPTYLWRPVADEVERRLKQHFDFAAARFDGVITAAEVVRVMQAVTGVEAVDLDQLSAFDGQAHHDVSRGQARRCWARPPSWQGGELKAAELLILGEVDLVPFVAPRVTPSESSPQRGLSS